MTNPNDLVGKALIKYTEQELDLILMALKSITSLKIPVKEEVCDQWSSNVCE